LKESNKRQIKGWKAEGLTPDKPKRIFIWDLECGHTVTRGYKPTSKAVRYCPTCETGEPMETDAYKR